LSKAVITATLEDALHFTAEQRAEIEASYEDYERDARIRGIPILGSGRIFTTPESDFREDQVNPPAHWARIAGIDFGWDHPTAVAWIAWDRDNDVCHVYDAYRKSKALVVVHASAIKTRGGWIPVAWPKDGEQTRDGAQEAEKYRGEGVALTSEFSQFAKTERPTAKSGETQESVVSVEASVRDMRERIETGRLKVAAHLSEWWEEYRLYHRENGKIVDVNEDLLKATMYGLRMLRFARTPPIGQDARALSMRIRNWRV
jgi:hypothetical protein